MEQMPQNNFVCNRQPNQQFSMQRHWTDSKNSHWGNNFWTQTKYIPVFTNQSLMQLVVKTKSERQKPLRSTNEAACELYKAKESFVNRPKFS